GPPCLVIRRPIPQDPKLKGLRGRVHEKGRKRIEIFYHGSPSGPGGPTGSPLRFISGLVEPDRGPDRVVGVGGDQLAQDALARVRGEVPGDLRPAVLAGVGGDRLRRDELPLDLDDEAPRLAFLVADG